MTESLETRLGVGGGEGPEWVGRVVAEEQEVVTALRTQDGLGTPR